MDRYLHYYKRYHGHDQAQKFATKQLEATEKRMMELQETTSGSWIDVQFLKAANEMVIDCRRVLKNTYVFGYYLPTPAKRQRELFENLQEHLERFTETLSEMTELPLDQMDRSEIVNVTRVTESFLANLIQGAEAVRRWSNERHRHSVFVRKQRIVTTMQDLFEQVLETNESAPTPQDKICSAAFFEPRVEADGDVWFQIVIDHFWEKTLESLQEMWDTGRARKGRVQGAGGDDGEEKSQAYFVIKAAQERKRRRLRDEYSRFGEPAVALLDRAARFLEHAREVCLLEVEDLLNLLQRAARGARRLSRPSNACPASSHLKPQDSTPST